MIDFWDFTQAPPASSANEQLNPPYRTVFESREQDPLDPNQQLVAPMWWSGRRSATPTRRSRPLWRRLAGDDGW